MRAELEGVDPMQVYGITRCRKCGAPIMQREFVPTGQKLERRKKAAAKVPESVWKRQGLIVAPTPHQQRRQTLGMCKRCGYGAASWMAWRPMILVAAGFVAIVASVILATGYVAP
jgi:hypothetical protein